MVYTLNKDTVAIKIDNKNWIEATQGIAKNAWKGIDTTAYLQHLRNEWDEK